jgi:hypothetical protein
LLLANQWIRIRGNEYKVQAASTSSVTIIGGLSGPLFDNDVVYVMGVLGGVPIQVTTFGKRAVFVAPPIEYSGHITIAYDINAYLTDTDALSSGTPSDTISVKFVRPTPISTLRRLSDREYVAPDRTMMPGKFKLYADGITNRWGTQTVSFTDDPAEFENPAEPGYKAGA